VSEMAFDDTLFGEHPPSADQRPAVVAPIDGRRAIDAGAGTGKTTTLAYRALYLIASQTLRADELLVVTFTRKAAAEIGERITRTLDAARARLDPEIDPQGVTCATIHGLAARILAEFAYVCGFEAPPRAVTDGEARAIFDDVLDRAFAGIGVDASALPLAEIRPKPLRDALARLALQLKSRGMTPDAFESDALAAADALAAQSWGQVWKTGTRKPRIDCDPKPERSAEELAQEAERERCNVGWIAAVLREFDRELHERHAATYGDLLSLTVRLLREHPQVAATLRARWRHVLVDEFQDTAELQLAFLHEIFGDPDHPERAMRNVTIVGDFRQSIYGFNGADPQIMHAFGASADACYRLERNRRSRTQIVDAAHAVLVQQTMADDADRLQAVRGASDEPCVFVRITDDAIGNMAARVEEEAAAIADEAARLRAAGTRVADMAVLLRKRTHAQRYVEALAQRGLPVALDRRAGLLDMPEIRDARAWLRLIVDLNDTLALVRVLQSPQLGLSDASLARLAPFDPIAIYDEQTDDAHLCTLRAWLEGLVPGRSETAPAAVRRLFATVPLAASYARDAQAEARIANLRAFEALAQRFAADNDDARLPAFVSYLERSIEFDEAIEEASLDVDGIVVMTVHQAKGLEWPVVFVAGADNRHYKGQAPPTPVRRDDRNGALVFSRDCDDHPTLRAVMMKRSYDPATGQLLERNPRTEKEEREAARVLYVACTRARDRLYVSSPSTQQRYAPVGALLEHAAPWPQADLAQPLPNASLPATTRVRPGEPVPLPLGELAPPRISFTALATFETCPRLARYRYRLHVADVSSPRRNGAEWEGDGEPHLDAASFGSLVHRTLERWALARIDGEAIAVECALDAAAAEYATLRDADRNRALTFAQHAVEALHDLEPLAAERGFNHNVAGVDLYGVLDLIARDPSGTIHVIDYKTGTVIDDEHYALQLDLYARAAREEHPEARVRARLLRLSDDRAEFRVTDPPAPNTLERLVRDAGALISDLATPGLHCAACPYNGSPCADGVVS